MAKSDSCASTPSDMPPPASHNERVELSRPTLRPPPAVIPNPEAHRLHIPRETAQRYLEHMLRESPKDYYSFISLIITTRSPALIELLEAISSLIDERYPDDTFLSIGSSLRATLRDIAKTYQLWPIPYESITPHHLNRFSYTTSHDTLFTPQSSFMTDTFAITSKSAHCADFHVLTGTHATTPYELTVHELTALIFAYANVIAATSACPDSFTEPHLNAVTITSFLKSLESYAISSEHPLVNRPITMLRDANHAQHANSQASLPQWLLMYYVRHSLRSWSRSLLISIHSHVPDPTTPRSNIFTRIRSVSLSPARPANAPPRYQIIYSSFINVSNLTTVLDSAASASSPAPLNCLQFDADRLRTIKHTLTLPTEIFQNVLHQDILGKFAKCEHPLLECTRFAHSPRCLKGISSTHSRHPRMSLLGTRTHRFLSDSFPHFIELQLAVTFEGLHPENEFSANYSIANAIAPMRTIVVSPSHLRLSPTSLDDVTTADLQPLVHDIHLPQIILSQTLQNVQTSCQEYPDHASTLPSSDTATKHTMLFD